MSAVLYFKLYAMSFLLCVHQFKYLLWVHDLKTSKQTKFAFIYPWLYFDYHAHPYMV